MALCSGMVASATITKHSRLSGSGNRGFLSHGCRGWSPRSRCWQFGFSRGLSSVSVHIPAVSLGIQISVPIMTPDRLD